jgi:hypothetical protein
VLGGFQEGHEEAAGVGDVGERVFFDGGVQFGLCEDCDARGKAEAGGEGGFDFCLRRLRPGEDYVAAVEQRFYVFEAESVEEIAQLGHGDALRRADIDAPE